MGLFNDAIASDGRYLVDPDGAPAESVTYTPRGGTARTINAVVARNRFDTAEGIPTPTQSLTIVVANNATWGISAGEFNQGDTVTVAWRFGGTAERIMLPHPKAQTPAVLVFELRR
jgi:hypothetical protein